MDTIFDELPNIVSLTKVEDACWVMCKMTELEFVSRVFNVKLEKSFFYRFMMFLDTPEARKVVEFSPTQNANTFKFSVKKLKAECPELCVNSHKLKQEFEKIGFEVAFETPNWVLTHPALHIGSTRQELMEVWFSEALLSFENNKANLIPRIYSALNKCEQDSASQQSVSWTQDGKCIRVALNYLSIFSLGNVKNWGFKIETLSIEQKLIEHPLLNRNSSIIMWLAVYLAFDRSTSLIHLPLAEPIGPDFQISSIKYQNPVVKQEPKSLENSPIPSKSQLRSKQKNDQVPKNTKSTQKTRIEQPTVMPSLNELKNKARTLGLEPLILNLGEKVFSDSSMSAQLGKRKSEGVVPTNMSLELNYELDKLRLNLAEVCRLTPGLSSGVNSAINFFNETLDTYIATRRVGLH